MSGTVTKLKQKQPPIVSLSQRTTQHAPEEGSVETFGGFVQRLTKSANGRLVWVPVKVSG